MEESGRVKDKEDWKIRKIGRKRKGGRVEDWKKEEEWKKMEEWKDAVSICPTIHPTFQPSSLPVFQSSILNLNYV